MYKVLYAFKSEENYLVEFKLTNLPPSALPSDIYHWVFKSETDSGERVQKLHFVAMRSVEGREFREFREGALEFDDVEAIFKDKVKENEFYFTKIDHQNFQKEIRDIFNVL